MNYIRETNARDPRLRNAYLQHHRIGIVLPNLLFQVLHVGIAIVETLGRPMLLLVVEPLPQVTCHFERVMIDDVVYFVDGVACIIICLEMGHEIHT